MGDADVNMNGRPRLPYGVPYPPVLPDKIHWPGQHVPTDPDWRTHGRCYGARDDPRGEGFEIRTLRYDPAGNGLPRFPGDWEVQYMLGPPSRGAEWSDVIAKWGLQTLNKAGFLNLDLGLPDMSADPKGRYFSNRPEVWEDEALHPVFRRDMWKHGLSDQEWSAIRPALLLASALLDDPNTMCLFHAIATPARHLCIMDPLLKKRLFFQRICDMRLYTYFYWETDDNLDAYHAYAYTVSLGDSAAGLGRTTTKIGLSSSFRQALMAWQQKGSTDDYSSFFNSVLVAGGVPASHAPEGFGDDLDSPALRTYVILASIILHELTHAFCFAHYERSYDEAPLEPFVGNQRASELGIAAERHIFGAIPRAAGFGAPPRMSRHVDAYAPFGMHIEETWAQWPVSNTSVKSLEEGKDADFATPIRTYPVPQRQVYDYFTDEFWRKKVPRYGHEALKFVKIPEWASSRMPGPDPQRPGINSTLR